MSVTLTEAEGRWKTISDQHPEQKELTVFPNNGTIAFAKTSNYKTPEGWELYTETLEALGELRGSVGTHNPAFDRYQPLAAMIDALLKDTLPLPFASDMPKTTGWVAIIGYLNRDSDLKRPRRVWTGTIADQVYERVGSEHKLKFHLRQACATEYAYVDPDNQRVIKVHEGLNRQNGDNFVAARRNDHHGWDLRVYRLPSPNYIQIAQEAKRQVN